MFRKKAPLIHESEKQIDWQTEINFKIEQLSKENFNQALDKAIQYKYATGYGYARGQSSLVEFLTLGIFPSVKGKIREADITKTSLQLEQNFITPQQALSNLLSTFIGNTNKMSFKYALFYCVFKIKANDDSAANTMISYAIKKLSELSDIDISLKEINNCEASVTNPLSNDAR